MSTVSKDRLKLALKHQFNQHRIVIWYDTESRLREFFDQADIDDVTKLEINNNEFGINHRILIEEPASSFRRPRRGLV